MSLLKEIKAGRGGKVREMLQQGEGSPQELEQSTGRTLLHLCVDREENDALEALLTHGEPATRPDLSVRDKHGEVA